MTRRGALLSASAAGLAGCTSWPDLKGIPRDPAYNVVDAHTHLFSASDLPVKNVVRYVIGPQFKLSPKVSAALGYICEVLKELSPTATAELAEEPETGLASLDLSKSKFADKFATASVERQGGLTKTNVWTTARGIDDAGGTSRDQGVLFAQLAHYREDAPSEKTLRDLAVDSGIAAFETRSVWPRKAYETRRQLILDVLDMVEAEQRNINRKPSAAMRAKAVTQFETVEILTAFGLARSEITPEKIAYAVVWAFNLLKPRTRHLLDYLQTYATGGKKEPPRVLMNFLVDYDKWLNDHPTPGSGMVEQINLWHRARAHYRNDVDIHTFAGYCPLKHAIETRLKASGRIDETAFDQIKKLIPKDKSLRKAAGIKLYPPMGFRPIGNRPLLDEDFIGKKRIEDIALKAWKEVKQKDDELGPCLDDALGEAYRWCCKHDVPLVAHASPGMKAGADFGDRTDTKYWHDVARAYQGKIRMSIGHLIHDAQKFADWRFPRKAELLGDSDDHLQDDGGWVAVSTTEFLKDVASNKWPVYFDIGYMEEIISPDIINGDCKDKEYLPVRFFRALYDWYKDIDRDCEHLVYGTDWIMLAQEPKHKFYLDKIQQWVECAGWPEPHRRNFFRENALRFLTPRDA